MEKRLVKKINNRDYRNECDLAMRKILLLAQQISLRTFTFQMCLPTICLWIFLQSFNKSSSAFTSIAVELHGSTRALRKGGIVSDEKNCIWKKKSDLRYSIGNINCWLHINQHDVNQYVARPIQLCQDLRFSHVSCTIELNHYICCSRFYQMFHMLT